MKTGNYRDTTYWWDDEDRQYTLEAVWYYEDGHREIPDSWWLESLIVEEQEKDAPDIDHLLVRGGEIWRMVENEGMDNPEFIDERDYGDYYL